MNESGICYSSKVIHDMTSNKGLVRGVVYNDQRKKEAFRNMLIDD